MRSGEIGIDPVYLISEIASAALTPIGLVLALLLPGILLGWSRRPAFGRGLCVLGTLALVVLAMPATTYALYGALESRYPPEPMASVPRADYIVVLGGGIDPPLPPRQMAELGVSADRILHAKRLLDAGKAPHILLTGGSVYERSGISTESEYAAELLVELGVPREVLLLEKDSRNTHENALSAARLIDQRGEGAESARPTVLLVTSASHMPRAMGAFLAAGLDVRAAPTDFRIVERTSPGFFDFVPSGLALAKISTAFREYLGIAVYRWRGWIA